MQRFSRSDVLLVPYPFSDLSAAKVRPAVIVNAARPSRDLLVVPLTSRTTGLLIGEFVLSDWKAAGLNVPTAVKRALFTIEQRLVRHTVGTLSSTDTQHLDTSLRAWLGL